MEILTGFFEAVFLSFIGWFLWNWAWYNVEKNEYDDQDKPFPIQQYKAKHKEEWIGSLATAILLLCGAELMDLVEIFGGPTGLSWSTAFYTLSGLAYEGLLKFIKQFRKRT